MCPHLNPVECVRGGVRDEDTRRMGSQAVLSTGGGFLQSLSASLTP